MVWDRKSDPNQFRHRWAVLGASHSWKNLFKLCCVPQIIAWSLHDQLRSKSSKRCGTSWSSGGDHGHLWPYHPVTCDPIIPGHLRPYYPVTCDPIPLITLTPPAFHHTIVSILLLYLNFPPCVPLYHCLHSTSLFKLPPLRSTIPLSPFYFFI